MEAIEQIYRDTLPTHRKYIKRLTKYVEVLMEKGRFLEAKYYFEKLLLVSPSHVNSIRLGYTLSIHLFDRDGVLKYDKFFMDKKISTTDLYWLRLKFYISINNKKKCEEYCVELLKNGIDNSKLSTVIEACINSNSYKPIPLLIQYVKKNKFTLNPRIERKIKLIAINQLANSIIRLNNEKILSS
ncbi:hypothetical protein IQ22_04081 [Pseudomonas duriflava]|uniref:Tetratricopeptide repeat protein n=1 Tax=Pseudomonas duriflava TaxID=459528 RepID=A0A562PX31_9PSED|nr:hypothetical protein IQ22_04081 [Pseudomonas duriflava]